MKFSSRLFVSALAVSLLALPVAAEAQQRHGDFHRPGHETVRRHHHDAPRHVEKKRHHWSKGRRYAEWKRRPAVRDWRRHGLRRPGPGQHWVKVDNDYLLINLATGIIAGVMAAR